MWHAKTYPSQKVIPAERLRAGFARLVADGGPGAEDLGVFVFYPPRSPVATLFFPPATARLAQAVDAEPCEKPVLRPGMGLYLGHGSPTQACFPESFPPA